VPDPVISVEGVSKRFRLYHERPTSVKERVLRLRGSRSEDFWALRDVSLEVPEGHAVGLVGANGSGKTTLLKIIGGILRPSDGRVTTRGRIAALLELGAGFHPELTGRENVYLNASILGLTKKETDRYFDDIVAFAELEDFIDNQVKHYSSGMFVRLGFAVAVHVNPSILLVDEVLAVGDEAFQRKCLARVREFQREGRTIVVVTHAMQLVARICDDAVMLDRGRVVASGDVHEVIKEYRVVMVRRHAGFARRDVTRDIEIAGVQMVDPKGNPSSVILPGERLQVVVEFRANRPIEDPVASMVILDGSGDFVFRTGTADLRLGRMDGTFRVTWDMEAVPLPEGRYFLTIGIHDRAERVVYDWHDQRYGFDVSQSMEADTRMFIPIQTRIDRYGTAAAVGERDGE
jgi:ABC-type polysaccharide/polyol phosphate transport system ATPase subunit